MKFDYCTEKLLVILYYQLLALFYYQSNTKYNNTISGIKKYLNGNIILPESTAIYNCPDWSKDISKIGNKKMRRRSAKDYFVAGNLRLPTSEIYSKTSHYSDKVVGRTFLTRITRLERERFMRHLALYL